jgi:hypothetical protein
LSLLEERRPANADRGLTISPLAGSMQVCLTAVVFLFKFIPAGGH